MAAASEAPPETPPVNRVAIIGAGLSGLALGYALVRRAPQDAPIEVSVFEREGRAGGLVGTDRVDGFLYERGPNGFLDRAPATLALVDALGLAHRLQRSHDHARRRFIYRNGRLNRLPASPVGLLTSGVLSLPGVLRMASEPFVRKPAAITDESVHDFAARRFGEEAATVLADAMVSGVFAGDARRLSMQACFPAVARMEREHGSVVRAMRARSHSADGRHGLGLLTSFPEGMRELVEALAQALRPNLHLAVGVEHVQRLADQHRLTLSNGARVVADCVVFATGSETTARLLAPTDAALAADIGAIPNAPMVTVSLAYPATAIARSLAGFGFLAPRNAGLRLLGVLWESSIFADRAPSGDVLLRAMLGGATDPEAVNLDDDQLRALVETELRTSMQVKGFPTRVRVVRQRPGIPQYVVGHDQRVARIESALERWPGLMVAGQGFRGVGVNACIEDASSMADRVISMLSARNRSLTGSQRRD
jgi:oxygen-dependent protoporphyrinogen oxidase